MKSIWDSFRLDGKRSLVTGSSRGIGKAIAMALGEAGAEVIFHGSQPGEKLAASLEEAKKKKIQCRSVTGDLSDPEQVQHLISPVGEIDILVLNASVQKYQRVPEFNMKEFETEFRVNVGSAFLLIQGFLPGMLQKKWGRVISLGSVNQWKQSPRLAVYAATKSALCNLIQNCAREYGKDGITFNNIAPGVIATDRNQAVLSDPQQSAEILKLIPAGRFGQAEDMAGLALLLCSEAGSYLTGSDIPVAGGRQL